MPRERQIRQATGRTRKTTLRRTQQEYRAQRGLNSAQTDLRTLHQHEILSHDALQATINRGQVNLLSSLDDQNNSEEEEEIHEDLEVLDDSLLLSQFARADLLHQESIHFDVHNEEKNEYKDPSHRTIAGTGRNGWRVTGPFGPVGREGICGGARARPPSPNRLPSPRNGVGLTTPALSLPLLSDS